MSIRRNTAYNIFGATVPVAVSLITVPLYLGLIGETRYGVLAIAWLLLGYFGLFDLGLGRATAQRIAALRHASAIERAQLFWTALILNIGLGMVGGMLIWPIANYFFGYIFKVEETLRPELQAAVPWLILAVPTATISGVLGGALQGREKFFELNLISVFSTFIFQVLPLVFAAYFSVSLTCLLPAALFSRLISLIILFQRCRKHVFKGHHICFVKQFAGQLLRFGGWVTVTSFIGPIMVTLDRFIIGSMVSAKAVAYYTVPFNIAERSSLLPGALSSAIYPRLAACSTPKEASRLSVEALHALLVVVTPFVVIGLLLVGPFLSWWVGTEFAANSTLVGQILLLGFWINNFARIPFAQLQASGRPDVVARCHIAEVLPYLAILYFGLYFLGLPGAAIAFSLRVFFDFLLLACFSGVLQEVWRKLISPSIILSVSFWVANQFTPGKSEWFFSVGLVLLGTLIWAWRNAPSTILTMRPKQK